MQPILETIKAGNEDKKMNELSEASLNQDGEKILKIVENRSTAYILVLLASLTAHIFHLTKKNTSIGMFDRIVSRFICRLKEEVNFKWS